MQWHRSGIYASVYNCKTGILIDDEGLKEACYYFR